MRVAAANIHQMMEMPCSLNTLERTKLFKNFLALSKFWRFWKTSWWHSSCASSLPFQASNSVSVLCRPPLRCQLSPSAYSKVFASASFPSLYFVKLHLFLSTFVVVLQLGRLIIFIVPTTATLSPATLTQIHALLS